MGLNEAIAKAIDEHRPRVAGRIVDRLRLQYGLKYDEIYNLFQKASGIDVATFDELMYEADMN